jgi:hypothetical protein
MPWPCFIPGERTPDTHWIGGWVGLRASLDVEARIKILYNPLIKVINKLIDLLLQLP